jgi:hypothetical protein
LTKRTKSEDAAIRDSFIHEPKWMRKDEVDVTGPVSMRLSTTTHSSCIYIYLI